MNILPHKSWNVYNKKNIEKVRRDEAKAQEEEQAKAERVTLAESEARLNLLRDRAQKKQQQLQSTAPESALIPQLSTTPTQHINLFEEEAKAHAQNEEHIAEQKAKDDKWERQITMYLDKGTDKESTPWYAIKEHDRFGESLKEGKKRKKDETKEEHRYKKRWREPIKLDEDPLVEINSSLSKRVEKHRERHPENKKKYKKEKKSSSSSSSIEGLRAQRLERERKERARTKSYVYGEVEDTKPPLDDRHYYSSQFNPTETAEAKKRKRDRYYHH
ncbi:hypothetical protein BDA99DRAFT_494677 [Phascolomyces articulosus]|uniref:CBF1-interacting co-repressor CIR N-terminal domain-containing protein n=1 Tax=Phascolomyces articulosus TaxID=60185 RepID=A0AAD5KPK5_9FUNG|nr:hypothetical protein BDA99DRAFT_494677 [Phascolomyces articulosus]